MSLCHAKIARVRLVTDTVDLSGTHTPLYLNKTCTHHSLNNTACLAVLFNEWPDTRSYSQTETAARPDGLGGLISPPPES